MHMHLSDIKETAMTFAKSDSYFAIVLFAVQLVSVFECQSRQNIANYREEDTLLDGRVIL